MHGLLEDLTVVEGAAFIAGPSCALHLAQMGATVIRFDMIGGGPDRHRWPLNATGHSLYWEGLNKGKKSIAIDLASAEGRDLAVAIITAKGEDRGLFVTNFPPDGFLSHQALSAVRPDLLTLRIQGWPDGRTGVDYTINAAVGVPFTTGPEDIPSDQPVNSALPAWDLLAGAYGAFALLAAERRRRITGAGGEIRVSLSDIAIGTLGHLGQLAEASLGQDRGRHGNALFGAFGRDFRTRDQRRIMLVAITPRQWKGLINTLGLGDAIAALEAELGLSFAKDEGQRFTHRARICGLIESGIASCDYAVLAAGLDKAGVCWEPYQTLQQAVQDDPRLVSDNALFTQVQHPGGDVYPTPGAIGRMNGRVPHGAPPAPRLGEHTVEVLADHLGLAHGQIGELIDRGVVATAE